jgi:hypothetical protein
MASADDLSRPWERPGEIVELKEGQPVNPVAYSIVSFKDRSQGWLPKDVVDRRAKKLHSDSSFVSWSSLDGKEQELWRHLARVQLTGEASGA